MPKSIIIKKNGGPEVLELQDVNIGSPGPDEIKVTNHAIGLITLILIIDPDCTQLSYPVELV
jgi:NADPH:quinone reductase and related Zn-dependent oxidoreductases